MAKPSTIYRCPRTGLEFDTYAEAKKHCLPLGVYPVAVTKAVKPQKPKKDE